MHGAVHRSNFAEAQALLSRCVQLQLFQYPRLLLLVLIPVACTACGSVRPGLKLAMQLFWYLCLLHSALIPVACTAGGSVRPGLNLAHGRCASRPRRVAAPHCIHRAAAAWRSRAVGDQQQCCHPGSPWTRSPGAVSTRTHLRQCHLLQRAHQMLRHHTGHRAVHMHLRQRGRHNCLRPWLWGVLLHFPYAVGRIL